MRERALLDVADKTVACRCWRCARHTSGILGPTSTRNRAEAREAADSSWPVVDLPHDASIELPRASDAGGPEGFVPTVQQWYRKHFRLPAAWAQDTAVTLSVDGALASSSWWVNGVPVVPLKTDGYLPLTIRLDGHSSGLNLTCVRVIGLAQPSNAP